MVLAAYINSDEQWRKGGITSFGWDADVDVYGLEMTLRTHERQHCELSEYTGGGRRTSLPLLIGGMTDRETVRV